MRKQRMRPEMTPLNRAAFRIGAEDLQAKGLEVLLAESMAQVFGGVGIDILDAACTEFTCNLYAPPPPPIS